MTLYIGVSNAALTYVKIEVVLTYFTIKAEN
jgi:hypothetical protein